MVEKDIGAVPLMAAAEMERAERAKANGEAPEMAVGVPEHVEPEGCCTRCCGCKNEEPGVDYTTTKRPRNRKITQQTLPACKPVYTRPIASLMFVAAAVVYIPLGIVFVVYGLTPVSVSYRYDDVCLQNQPDNMARQDYLWANAGNDTALTCNIRLPIDVKMEPPIYVYYEIKGMYQNFRRYVRSHLDLQLADEGDWRADVSSESLAQSCVPRIYYQQNDSQLINPCGLVAWSFFNDTYDLVKLPRGIDALAEGITVTEDGVAFSSDVSRRFADYFPQFFNPAINDERGGDNITGTVKQDQRFMVWMRLSHTNNFRKFWGIIDGTTLEPGDVVNVTLLNQYNTYPFDGEKRLVLATTSWLGGHGVVLGAIYLITGCMALVFCMIYLVITVVWPRPFADTSRLLKAPAPHPKAAQPV